MITSIYDNMDEFYVKISKDLNLQFLNIGDTIIIGKIHYIITDKSYNIEADSLFFSVTDNFKYAVPIHF